MPSSRRNARATPPAATRAVVSRADERSSDVADVVEAVLERAGEVRVAGPDARDRLGALVAVVGERRELGRLLVGQRPDLHDPGPVLPVAVGDLEQDRRAQRAAVADAGQDPRPVLLDRLAGAAAVAALAAGEVDGEVVLGEREARRARPRPRRPASGRGSRRP